MARLHWLLILAVVISSPTGWAQRNRRDAEDDAPRRGLLNPVERPAPATPPETPPGGPMAAPGGPGAGPGGPPPGGRPAPGVPPEGGAETLLPPPPPPPVDLPKGDVITLKNGKVLKNVQVARTTLTNVEVLTLLQPIGDLPPLVIPRKYIQSIEYDDYDPNSSINRPAQDGPAPGLMSGFEVSKDMGEKLHAKLSGPPLNFENQDLIEILKQLSERLGVRIDVSDGVRAMPVKDRLWTFLTTDDMTLFTLLQEKLPEKFPNLAVDYEFDRIWVRTKDEKAPAKPTGAPETEQARAQ